MAGEKYRANKEGVLKNTTISDQADAKYEFLARFFEERAESFDRYYKVPVADSEVVLPNSTSTVRKRGLTAADALRGLLKGSGR